MKRTILFAMICLSSLTIWAHGDERTGDIEVTVHIDATDSQYEYDDFIGGYYLIETSNSHYECMDDSSSGEKNNTGLPKEANYFPTGMTWKEVLAEPNYLPLDTTRAWVYEIGTDTMIDQKSYKKVYVNGQPTKLWIREEGTEVYLLTDKIPLEFILYDFGWDDNKIMYTYYLQENGSEYGLKENSQYAPLDYKTKTVGDRNFQYISDCDGTTIRDIGRVTELNKNGSLLGYAMPEEILPGLIYNKVLWVRRNNQEIFRSEVAEEWIPSFSDEEPYRPFIEEGKQWVVLEEIWTPMCDDFISYKRTFTIEGDTIIGDAKCKKMRYQEENRIEGKNTDEYFMALREEGKRVYFYPRDTTEPLLLYDFGVAINDTLEIYIGNYESVNKSAPQACKVVALKKNEKGILMQNLSGKEIWHRDDYYWDWIWIEGVGSIIGPTMNMTFGKDYDLTRWLAECRIGDNIIYQSELQESDFPPYFIAVEGKTWRTGVCVAGTDDFIEYNEYRIHGDTLINHSKHKILEKGTLVYNSSGEPFINYSFYIPLLELGGRVYYPASDNKSWNLLYDFTAPVGVNIKSGGKSYNIVRREKCQAPGFKGECTYLQAKDDPDYQTYWMEGVGSTSNPMNNLVGTIPSYYDEILLSCSVGDETLYLKDGLPPTDISEVKKHWLDFTHTTKPRPKSPGKKEGPSPSPSPTLPVGAREPVGARDEADGEEMVTGEYSAKELFVNLKTLTGPYVVTLTDDNGKEVYRKEVQTSNIVALNTDLTKYVDGTYTLVVENSEEQYTATLALPLIDDAVRDLPSTINPKPSTLNWYDLSGRHLTTPPTQKGVYIREGRKVLVK